MFDKEKTEKRPGNVENYISLYMAIQMIRSKEFRENIKEVYERLPLLIMKKNAKTDEERENINSIELEIKIKII